jgi:hypothetical protein
VEVLWRFGVGLLSLYCCWFVSTELRRDDCKAYELKVYATSRSAANCNVKEDSASLCPHQVNCEFSDFYTTTGFYSAIRSSFLPVFEAKARNWGKMIEFKAETLWLLPGKLWVRVKLRFCFIQPLVSGNFHGNQCLEACCKAKPPKFAQWRIIHDSSVRSQSKSYLHEVVWILNKRHRHGRKATNYWDHYYGPTSST